MSDIQWANPVSGQFNVETNWIGGAVPKASDNAFMESGGNGYVVTDATNQDVATINIGAGVVLEVSGSGTELSCVGAGSVQTINNGLIDVDYGALFELGGDVANVSTIEIGGELIPTGLILSGGGVVEFDRKNAQIRDFYDLPFQNIDNTITTGTGNGLIRLATTVVNGAEGAIIQTAGHRLKIALGGHQFRNYGLVEAQGAGQLTIAAFTLNEGVIESENGKVLVQGSISNDGTIESDGGSVTVTGKVDGTGLVEVMGGTVTIDGRLSQPVTFGATGTLTLGDATRFKAAVTGFSTGTAFDLEDIGFVGAGEATFKGSTTSGRLTVTDGVHTAHISLTGDYRKAIFTAASDGHGGVIVTETAAGVQRFVAAVASLAPSPVESVREARGLDANVSPSLAHPHTQFA